MDEVWREHQKQINKQLNKKEPPKYTKEKRIEALKVILDGRSKRIRPHRPVIHEMLKELRNEEE